MKNHFLCVMIALDGPSLVQEGCPEQRAAGSFVTAVPPLIYGMTAVVERATVEGTL